MFKPGKFRNTLIGWYGRHKRDLPWRNTSDPFAIWVSEIILQQTRVDQGLPYYRRFIEKFPDVASLAGAGEREVLKLWQGLGYYSRARNMHRAAGQVMEDYGGIFPTDYASILALKGVGGYTAAAIASFAFGLPYAVVDGNVKRVISRFCGIEEDITSPGGTKAVEDALDKLFDRKRPGTFNQAIMEFGALQCTPANPQCQTCPFASECKAFEMGATGRLPFKPSAAVKKDRFFHYAVMRLGKRVVLRKRKERDIWHNLYDFPHIEMAGKTAGFRLELLPGIAGEAVPAYKKGRSSGWKVHILSHQKIHARFHEFRLEGKAGLPAGWELTSVDKIGEYPLPKLIESYFNGR